MIRKIIKIDENKCTGCGVCADACHEGAIGMIDGKAKLLREDYCDGLGDCLPACPVNAISFEEREAPAYNETAVLEAKKLSENCEINAVSRLSQWPVQIKLVPVNAPYFSNANLLVSADCTAYAYGNFHERFIKNHITLIGCPKLDNEDYSEKLTQIIAFNTIKSITVVRMEVPCCSGLQKAVEKAVKNSGKQISCNVVIISADGRILN